MRRISLAVSLFLLAGIVRPATVFAQGIGEMGGAYAASSGQTPALMNSGVHGAVGSTMSGAIKNINAATSGESSKGSSGSSSGVSNTTSGKGAKSSAPKDGDEPLTAAQTAKRAGDQSNKLYTEAQAKLKAGDLENADKLFRNSLYYRESIWGAKDPAVPKIYEILGDIAHKRAAPAEAEKCYHKALTSLIKVYGPGDYVMVPLLNKLGTLYLETFKFADAVNVYKQSYDLNTRKNGDSDTTIASVINYSKALLGDEDYREASSLLRDYSTRLDKGPDSNLAQLSSILELYQTALQKTNQTDMLQKVQTRSQQVKDQLLAAQAVKEETKPADAATAGGAAPTDAADKTPAPSTPAASAPATAAPAAAATPAATKAPSASASPPAKSEASGNGDKTSSAK